MKFRSAAFILLFAAALGCDDSNGLGSSKFRAVNASPDSGAMDVYLDGDLFYDRVPFGEATGYSKIDADNHEVRITLNDSFTTFYDVNRAFSESDEYTLFLFDFIENGTGVLVRDDNNRPASGQVKLRLVHGAPSLDDVDIYVTDWKEPLSGTTPTFEAVRFREIPDYVESIEGTYQVRATLRGTTDVVADTGALPLEGSRIISIVLIENDGGGRPYRFAIYVDS